MKSVLKIETSNKLHFVGNQYTQGRMKPFFLSFLILRVGRGGKRRKNLIFNLISVGDSEKRTSDKKFEKRASYAPAAIFSLQNEINLKSLSYKLTSNFSFPFSPILAILVAKEAVTVATVGYRGKCPI